MKPSRYSRVTAEVRSLRARRVIEVGTWRGDRALEMAEAALEHGGLTAYHGFDLWETMTPERRDAELHVKQTARLAEVRGRFDAWEAQHGGRPDFVLHLGDTRETLPAFAALYGGYPTFDLAWIDGGHSEETIRSDWEACLRLVRPGGVLLLDDFYRPARPGLGCNALVAGLLADGAAAEILPEQDPVRGGGSVQIVRVPR